jgi:hypothetical protein
MNIKDILQEAEEILKTSSTANVLLGAENYKREQLVKLLELFIDCQNKTITKAIKQSFESIGVEGYAERGDALETVYIKGFHEALKQIEDKKRKFWEG